MRWNDDKSWLFQALRAAGALRSLADVERAELAQLLDDLDADEVEELHPAMKRAEAHAADLAAEQARLEGQADALVRIAAEYEGLLTDATAYLQRLRDKSAALAEDYRRLMGDERVPSR